MLASAFLAVLVAVLLLFSRACHRAACLQPQHSSSFLVAVLLAGRRGLVLAGLVVLVGVRILLSISATLADRLPADKRRHRYQRQRQHMRISAPAGRIPALRA